MFEGKGVAGSPLLPFRTNLGQPETTHKEEGPADCFAPLWIAQDSLYFIFMRPRGKSRFACFRHDETCHCFGAGIGLQGNPGRGTNAGL